MNFKYGIITNNNITNLYKIIDSIELQNIPNYEIIIVGVNINLNKKNCTCIQFDESIYPGWIARKKNIITQNAKYEGEDVDWIQSLRNKYVISCNKESISKLLKDK